MEQKRPTVEKEMETEVVVEAQKGPSLSHYISRLFCYGSLPFNLPDEFSPDFSGFPPHCIRLQPSTAQSLNVDVPQTLVLGALLSLKSLPMRSPSLWLQMSTTCNNTKIPVYSQDHFYRPPDSVS